MDFLPEETTPLIAKVRAENQADKGTIHVIGSTHGRFPTLDAEGALLDVSTLQSTFEPRPRILTHPC